MQLGRVFCPCAFQACLGLLEPDADKKQCLSKSAVAAATGSTIQPGERFAWLGIYTLV